MQADPHRHVVSVPGSPARKAFAIEFDVDLPQVSSAIYVGSSGDVVLIAVDSDIPVIYRNVPSGAYLTVRTKRVLSQGSTASNLVCEV